MLAVISFGLKFSYVLSGWERSAHDSCVLEDALTRLGVFKYPKTLVLIYVSRIIMQNIVRLGKSNFFFSILDKYYLVDVGYGIRNGFIPPYSGVRYHLKEYDDNPPQNEKSFSIFVTPHCEQPLNEALVF